MSPTTPGPDGIIRRLGNHAYGAAFLLVVAALLALSVATFQKRFANVVMVTLDTDRIGSQLQEASDVKIRGLVVGEVRHITVTPSGARLDLALEPDQVGLIPGNVAARLLPKTLFGERFVDLVIPPTGPQGRLQRGAHIGQDRTAVAIELERVFDDLLPLLRTVQPEKLAATLNALATTLDGRGTQLGRTIVLAERYLEQVNPKLPVIQQDISGLADLASTYAVVAPQLLRAATALLTTNKTIVERKDDLAGFFAGTAGFANTATDFLAESGDRIIQVGRVQRPTLAVLAKYSPTYPCMASGLVEWLPRIDRVWSGPSFHITLEVAPQRPAYHPGEEPAWGEHRGPNCFGLPHPPGSQAHPRRGAAFDDGTDRSRGSASLDSASLDSAASGSGSIGSASSALPSALLGRTGAASGDPDTGSAGTVDEQELVAALLSPEGGRPSALTTLLAGPLLRGMVVSNS